MPGRTEGGAEKFCFLPGFYKRRVSFQWGERFGVSFWGGAPSWKERRCPSQAPARDPIPHPARRCGGGNSRGL